jgi:hypothetical protein
MAKFMTHGRYVTFRRFELLEHRQLNEIARWRIERTIASVLDHGRKAREEVICVLNPHRVW